VRLLDGEMTAQQLREVHDVYGGPVYRMAVRVQSLRTVLRKTLNDPEARPSRTREVRTMLARTIAEGETHGLLRTKDDEVWLVPPPLTVATPTETRAEPARSTAEAAIEQKTLLELIELASATLSELRESRARLSSDDAISENIILRAASYAADSATSKVVRSLSGDTTLGYGPDGKLFTITGPQGVTRLVYDQYGRLIRLERPRMDA